MISMYLAVVGVIIFFNVKQVHFIKSDEEQNELYSLVLFGIEVVFALVFLLVYCRLRSALK